MGPAFVATGHIPVFFCTCLDSSKRPPILVTINGHTHRSTLASRRGQFMLPISAENRPSAGVAAGDEVDGDSELDTEPREVTVPPDMAEALERDVDAKRFFDGFKTDWAHQIKELVDVHYPEAERIVLVKDTLNTHTNTPASLYMRPSSRRRPGGLPRSCRSNTRQSMAPGST